ncbi:MAG: IgGFc-binding protein [Deltaproteobacteria bacterium]|nr:IgGFc-binding protein [Deltaproteobacteria bacterium]
MPRLVRNGNRILAVVGVCSAMIFSACSSDNPGETKDAVQIDPDALNKTDAGDVTGGTDTLVVPDGAVCAPGAVEGCATDSARKVCAADGSGWVSEGCYSDAGDPTQCKLPGVCTVCVPGQKRCRPDDDSYVQDCNGDGEWVDGQQCDGVKGQQCYNGICGEACEINVKANSYIGCSFWAADLDNAFVSGGARGYYDAAGAQYSIVISNPSDKLAANITISTVKGPVLNDSEANPLDLSPLNPGELRVFNLPARNINGTVKDKLGYRVTSTVPITAYQFNPLENVNVFSNDASLLLPEELLGRYYMVMSREQSFGVLRGFVTVMATLGGQTTVNITFSGTAGKTLASSDESIKVFKAGESAEFVLDQWDTLNIETDQVGSDLTGTVVVANKRVAVFAGSEAANAPNTNHCLIDSCTQKQLDSGTKCGVCEYDGTTPCFNNEHCSSFITCCADHLEHQMFPVKTWGSRYLAVKLYKRNDEADYWRILAAEDGTKVTTIPPVKDPKGKNVYVPVLNKGEWFEIETKQNFEIVAKHVDGSPAPIMVGHFMASQDAPDPNTVGPQPGDAGTGDPAMMLGIPVEQWRKDFVFLTPNKYAFNYVSIGAPIDANVSLDGQPLPPDFWEKVSNTYKATKVFVGEGVHKVLSDQAVAVEVYGFDQYVSYGYAAGLDLKDLKLVKEPGE